VTLDGSSRAGGLLTEDDPPPYEEVPARRASPFLLVCDHASNRVPRRLDSLGLPAAELGRHIGWDIGAADVARALADLLGAPAILSSYSRLVIDKNRWLDDPSATLAESDGTVVPGNVGLTPEARRIRAEEIYWPYHRAVEAALARMEAHGTTPVLVAVHSFTPCLFGRERPWHIGVLWNQDERFAVPLLAELGRTGLTIGDNEPYTGRNPGDFTVPYHAEQHGRLAAMLEIRQDEIAIEEGAQRYAELLAEALERTLRG
jgi:predicted N-formylglutamate amidohydrolase